MANYIQSNIPGLPDRSRMPGIPDARMGIGPISGDDIGGKTFKDLYRLGQAVQHDGHEQMQFAIRKYEERADADSDGGAANDSIAINEERARLAQIEGVEARETRENLDKFTQQRMDATRQALPTDRARELYDKKMRRFTIQNSMWADEYIIERDIENSNTKMDARTEQLKQDAIGEIALRGGDRGYDRIVGDIGEIKQYVAQRNAGQPPEEIQNKISSAVMGVTESAAKAAAEKYGPKAALDFLNSGIEAEFTSKGDKAKFELLRKKYEEANGYAEASQWAFRMVDTDMPASEIMRQAYEAYPEDPKMANFVLSTAEGYRDRKGKEVNFAAAQATSQLWGSFRDAGFNLENMPPEARAEVTNDPKLFQEMSNYQAWFNKAGNDKLDPHLEWIDEKLSLSPSDLQAWVNGPQEAPGISNYDLLYRKCGKDTAKIHEFEKRLGMKDEQARGGGSPSTSINPDDWFENNYGAMYESGIFFKGPAAYDPKSEDAKRQGNGFRIRYRDRLAQKEEELKRKANSEEQKGVAFQLIRDVRDGLVKLDSAYYDEQNAAATAPAEMPVRDADLTEEQKLVAGDGRKVARMNPATKTVEKFEIVPKGQWFEDLKPVAKSVEKTLQRGEMGETAYDLGDYLVTMPNGMIAIYDRGWNRKGAVISDSVIQANSEGEQQQPALPDITPAKTTKMRVLEEEEGVQFNWRGDLGVWIGTYPSGVQMSVSPIGRKRMGRYGGPKTDADWFVRDAEDTLSWLKDRRDQQEKTQRGLHNLEMNTLNRKIGEQEKLVESLRRGGVHHKTFTKVRGASIGSD